MYLAHNIYHPYSHPFKECLKTTIKHIPQAILKIGLKENPFKRKFSGTLRHTSPQMGAQDLANIKIGSILILNT